MKSKTPNITVTLIATTCGSRRRRSLRVFFCKARLITLRHHSTVAASAGRVLRCADTIAPSRIRMT